ncbi:nuclear cap-binding protein subunit 3 isoform X3 [Colossoma macropomum]|uniref:nuclear cap-binding protein subunit 3 isoform X3 n=1 Tax=Colossoma macropomum TaxID=42526 RepID=UPI0018648671|nr:nuclear cap-binding protein subunit 3 isoform X3 [Colossoma macropomum]
MAAVRSLRVSVKPESASDRSDSDSDSDSDRNAREAEPMEVEEGELEFESIPVRRSLKELLPDTSRRYENKAGAFITGIDVTSKEAIEKKEKRARRFHFRAEDNLTQRNVVLDRELMKKAIPKIRLEALHLTGVDDMSTQDVFGYFKEYPPAHIEWIDDTSCNVVWLDDVTSTRALINMSRMPDKEVSNTDGPKTTDLPIRNQRAARTRGSDDEEEEGEVDDDDDVVEKANKSSDDSEGKASESEEETEKKETQESSETDLFTQAERDSLLRNDLRPTTKSFKGNKLFLRFATQDDKKELGAARRSRYYMKYGNPNYGGMKGILSNSWKRRYHTRRIQRDVLKTKKTLIGDSMGHTPPYTHRHSADLVNLPEEPIEEEEEEEEDREEDMDADDRVVEYRDRGDRDRGDRDRGDRERGDRERGSRIGEGGLRSRLGGSSSASSDSDEMDYDLELKMISTPSPKKSMKMTMYADEVESNLRSLRNSIRSDSGSSSSSVRSRIGSGVTKSTSEKVTDVRQLLEEKRQGTSHQRTPPLVASIGKTDVRQRLGKRPHSPDRQRSVSPVPQRNTAPRREPLTDVHSRLGVTKQETRGLYSESSKDKKSGKAKGGLWSRLGPSKDGEGDRKLSGRLGSSASLSRGTRQRDEVDSDGVDDYDDEDDDSQLQKMWGAMIKQKEQQSSKMKKSRLDNLPSLQIEISRDSSNGSDSDS